VVLGLGLASTPVATGQQLEAHLRLNGSEVRKAFEPLRFLDFKEIPNIFRYCLPIEIRAIAL